MSSFLSRNEDGTYKKVINEVETESSIDEMQELIDSGKYKITELTF